MNTLFQTLANTADGAFIVDEDQFIVYWNKAAEEILGYRSDEVVGQHCYNILRGCNTQGQVHCCPGCDVINAVFSGETMINHDLAVQTKAGQMRWVNVSILTAPPTDTEPSTMIIHLIRDVTQIKLNEQLVHQMFNATEPALPKGPPNSSSPSLEPHIEKLTKRECEVLSLLIQGLSTQDIAQGLSISTVTVRNHIQRILYKLHVHSRLEAVAYAIEHNLVDHICS